MPVLPTILFRNYITTKHVLTYLNHSYHNYFYRQKKRALNRALSSNKLHFRKFFITDHYFG